MDVPKPLTWKSPFLQHILSVSHLQDQWQSVCSNVNGIIDAGIGKQMMCKMAGCIIVWSEFKYFCSEKLSCFALPSRLLAAAWRANFIWRGSRGASWFTGGIPGGRRLKPFLPQPNSTWERHCRAHTALNDSVVRNTAHQGGAVAEEQLIREIKIWFFNIWPFFYCNMKC